MAARNSRNSNRPVNIDEDHLESVNESLAESLSTKLGTLKHLALDLDTEARDHLPLLDGVSDDMESGSVRMGSSSSRIRNIGRSRGLSGRKFTCLVGIAVTFIMVIIYYILLPMAWK